MEQLESLIEKQTLRNKYAVKSILRESMKKDVAMLESEINILKELDHPNIVRFYETYIDYKYIHIVMQL